MIITRKQLRRDLATLRLRECQVGTTSMSLGAAATFGVMDVYLLANTDYTNQNLYQRAYVRVASADYRVGSYNAGSGALVSAQLLRNAIASGADFELHDRLTATELDACLDQTILDLRVEREVGFPTVDGAWQYTVDTAASPNTIIDYKEVYSFAAPTSTTNRQRIDLPTAQLVQTATGMELRLGQALAASQQIVIDAYLQLSLPADDAATINIPDRDWVLWGAAARAYDLLIQRTPGQDAALLAARRAEAARAFSKKSEHWQPAIEHKLGFEGPPAGITGRQSTSGIDPF